MSNEQWAILRKRLYNTLPYVPALLVAYGVMSESMAVLWVALVAQLIGPAIGHTAAHYVDVLDARYIDGVNDGSIKIPGFNTPNVSRETIAARCVDVHGTGEPHVLGCEGWTFESR
jgi:hypothetical protein